LIIDHTGSYRLGWLAVALVVAVGVVAIRQVTERPHPRHQTHDEPRSPESVPHLPVVEGGDIRQ
jgi:hypothetical protein